MKGKKLVLNRETVRDLTADEKQRAVAGVGFSVVIDCRSLCITSCLTTTITITDDPHEVQ